jgi:hypothetical protein
MKLWKIAGALGAGVVGVVALGAAGIYLKVTSQPGPQALPMPDGATALDDPAGARWFADAHKADHEPLSAAHQTQEQPAWCGVASSVAVINAATDPDISQDDFFTSEASAVRSWWKVTFGGMPIGQMTGMIAAHGLTAEAHFAGDEGFEAFLSEAERNLSTPGDFLVVNYDRAVVSEAGGGHISPVSALSADKQQILILDTATYKYPAHWVSTRALFDAMNTPDSESGKTRGWVVVR